MRSGTPVAAGDHAVRVCARALSFVPWLLICFHGEGFGANAAEGPRDHDSPFMAPGQVNTATESAAPIELHGIMATPKGMYFSIYDPVKKTATWVRLDEAGPGFVVHGYRIVNGTDQVIVYYQGATLTLELAKSKTASASTRTGLGLPSPRSGGPPITSETLLGVPLTELRPDEVAKLQNIINQVRVRLHRESTKEAEAGQSQDSGSETLPAEAPAPNVVPGGVRP